MLSLFIFNVLAIGIEIAFISFVVDIISVYLRMLSRTTFGLCFRVMLVCLAMPVLSNVSYTQDVWTKSAGIKAPGNSRLVSNASISLLYSPTHVFMSDNGGYVWWSIKEHFPNGLVTACTKPGKIIVLRFGKDRTFTLHSTTNAGVTWLWKAAFTLDAGQELVEMVASSEQLVAYTKQGVIYASADNGESWRRFRVASDLGDLVDVAVLGNTWVVCGTQATNWTTDEGTTWSKTPVPFKVGGYLVAVESSGGIIWGGGPFGVARFDMASMSWSVASSGLDQSTGIVPTVVELKDLDGVLFGIFRQSNNANTCFRWANTQWRPVDRGGLPYGTQIGRFCFSICKGLLQVFAHGSDANLQGVYVVKHQSPTDVFETNTNEVSVSPLPADESIVVSGLPPSACEGVIVNESGIRVAIIHVEAGGRINTNSLASGVYSLIIQCQPEQYIKRIVVQH